jgi:hypothetical protein
MMRHVERGNLFPLYGVNIAEATGRTIAGSLPAFGTKRIVVHLLLLLRLESRGQQRRSDRTDVACSANLRLKLCASHYVTSSF